MDTFFGFDSNSSAQWYQALEKPFFAPPSWVFGPVWSVLYVIIVCVFAYVCWQVFLKKLSSQVLIPLILNAVSNLAFTPLQFGLRNNVLALIDILIVLGSLAWLMWLLWKKQEKVASITLMPYVVWVTFATVLQISITALNT
jgi:tryptophan-rich sensory protein